MENNEVYTELAIQLARIEDKLDRIIDLETKVKVLEAELETRLKDKYYPRHYYKNDKCLWHGIPTEDLNKPWGLSCPCSNCSPYSLSGAKIASSALGLWKNEYLDLVGDEDTCQINTAVIRPGGGI